MSAPKERPQSSTTGVSGWISIGRISMWAVYRHPTDFPDLYVARRFTIGHDGASPTEDVLAALTLDGVRALLPSGLANLGREPNDEPHIIEAWI